MNKMLRRFALLLIPIMLAGCQTEGRRTSAQDGRGRLQVVASLFPQYDFARQIGGEYADVIMLLAPGVESHTYDPSSADMLRVYGADLFIYTGELMEPWAHRLLAGAGPSLTVCNAAEGISLLAETHEEGPGEEDAEAEHAHGYDPHVWLDLRNAAAMAAGIADSLCMLDPEHAGYYTANAEALIAEMAALDAEFYEVVTEGSRDTLVFGGRFAYRYFLERYGLRYVTAYDSCSTEAEPSMRRILEVVEYMRAQDVHYIFHEELVDPNVARTIAFDTGAELLLFATGHTVTKEQLESGVTFVELMRENLENVRMALA